MEYYAAERKKELLPFATWMKLESIVLSEISQAVKDKYHMISPTSKYFIWGWGTNVNVVFLISNSTCSVTIYRRATDFCAFTLYPATLL